jgi:hypothetical protein
MRTLSSALLSVLLTACSSTDVSKPNSGTSSGALSDAGGNGDGGDGGASTKKKNAESPCATNEECESNLCFMGGNQSYCSIPCTVANGPTVCVPPFTGSCNMRGACKRD